MSNVLVMINSFRERYYIISSAVLPLMRHVHVQPPTVSVAARAPNAAIATARNIVILFTGDAVDSTDHNGRDRTLGDPQSYFNENLVLLRLRRSQSLRPTGMVQHLVDG
jgi:hypothetical protein